MCLCVVSDIHVTPAIVLSETSLAIAGWGARADSTYCGKEAREDFRLRIHGSKEILAGVLALVLMFAGAQCLVYEPQNPYSRVFAISSKPPM